MPHFDPLEFGRWLKTAYEKSSFKSYAQLGRAAGVSRAYVSSLVRAAEQVLTNKPSQPSPDVVVKLATELSEDVDRALLLAGHAPLNARPRITNAAEFYAEIERMGFDQFIFSTKEREALERFTPEEFEELLEQIEQDVRTKIRRKMK